MAERKRRDNMDSGCIFVRTAMMDFVATGYRNDYEYGIIISYNHLFF